MQERMKEACGSPRLPVQYLLSNPNVRLVLLDDGLQHLPLIRDLEIGECGFCPLAS